LKSEALCSVAAFNVYTARRRAVTRLRRGSTVTNGIGAQPKMYVARRPAVSTGTCGVRLAGFGYLWPWGGEDSEGVARLESHAGIKQACSKRCGAEIRRLNRSIFSLPAPPLSSRAVRERSRAPLAETAGFYNGGPGREKV